MMKKYLFLILVFISTSLLAADQWPMGKWNMLDDFTELPQAIIQISATKGGGFEGKIIEDECLTRDVDSETSSKQSKIYVIVNKQEIKTE